MDGDGLEQAARTAAEHGAAAAAAAGGGAARARRSRPAALAPDTPEGVCANCETPLQGPVCHQCGQVDDYYHRPAHGLISDVLEGLAALDGRVVRTLPALLLRPGRITRAFLKGRRARYLPPFRLYIIASLVFFLLVPGVDNLADAVRSGASVNSADRAEVLQEVETQLQDGVSDGSLTEDEAARARAALAMVGMGRGQAASGGAAGDPESARAPTGPGAQTASGETGETGQTGETGESGESSDGASESSWADYTDGVDLSGGGDPEQIRRYFAPEDFGGPAPQTAWPLPVRRHLGDRFAEVAADPGGWIEAASAWIPRIMFVMVPVYALLLALTYAWRRGFYVFDHLIVSLHLHAALFLVMAALMLASNLIGAGWAWLGLLVYSNGYLYRIQRVVYGRGRVTSVLRTIVLDGLYFFVLLIGFIAVLLLGALV